MANMERLWVTVTAKRFLLDKTVFNDVLKWVKLLPASLIPVFGGSYEIV
jgi:hypothetical protein